MTAGRGTPMDRPRGPSHLKGSSTRAAGGGIPDARSAERAARVLAARRRGRRRLGVLALVVVCAASIGVGFAISAAPPRAKSSTSDSSAAQSHPLVAPTLTSSLAPGLEVPGRLDSLPFPSTGEAAVVVAGMGLVASTADERSVPVASVTKIMTAYLILKDHPLVGSAVGPEFTMTAADHDAWIRASELDESNVEVKAGERLDERQLLQALMIPSADNIADYLARWDAGSIPAFVAKMNAAAAALHLTHTHFADASGVNPGSRGSAVDMARLASIAMMNPVLRWVTDESFIKLPVEGEIWNNYDPAVGVDGIIGVKSGFTDAAQTNLVSAAWRKVGGRRVLVICDVVNQPNSLGGDAAENEAVLNAATKELRTAKVLRRASLVGLATAAWTKGSTASLKLAGPATIVGWGGLVLVPKVVPVPPLASDDKHGWAAGCTIAVLQLTYPYGTVVTEPVLLSSAIAPPPDGWVAPAGSH